jgi:hypothetical protein
MRIVEWRPFSCRLTALAIAALLAVSSGCSAGGTAGNAPRDDRRDPVTQDDGFRAIKPIKISYFGIGKGKMSQRQQWSYISIVSQSWYREHVKRDEKNRTVNTGTNTQLDAANSTVVALGEPFEKITQPHVKIAADDAGCVGLVKELEKTGLFGLPTVPEYELRNVTADSSAGKYILIDDGGSVTVFDQERLNPEQKLIYANAFNTVCAVKETPKYDNNFLRDFTRSQKAEKLYEQALEKEATRQLGEAIALYIEVVNTYDGTDAAMKSISRASVILLQEGDRCVAKSDRAGAIYNYQRIIQAFPGSNAAMAARNKLSELGVKTPTESR